MPTVATVHEPSDADGVARGAQPLRTRGHAVTVVCRERFPVADGMVGALHRWSDRYDRVVLVVSGAHGSTLSHWYSKELAMQHGMGTCANLPPAFRAADAVYQWGRGKNVVLLDRRWT